MSVGPVVFAAQGDQFILPAQLAGVIWEGATQSGDTVELREGILVNGVLKGTGNLIWASRTDVQQTYLGVTFGPNGQPAPEGFRLTIHQRGRLLVYLKEAGHR